MNNPQILKHNYESIAWGTFFIWWGITVMFPALPNGTGAIGIGLILLGLNAARAVKRVQTSGFTTTLGVIALVLGGVELARPLLHLPFDLPLFAILLIVIGLLSLIRELGRSRQVNYAE
jgi:hypothetical protein